MVAHTKPSWFVDDAWFNPLFHGFFAVTFFFVLSGFVLGLSYHDKFEDDKAGDLKKYFILRIARIYPIYALAILASMAGDYLYLDKTYSLGTILLNLSLLQAWFRSDYISFPAWSLSCEAFFYIIFPVVMIYVRRLSYISVVKKMMYVWILSLAAITLLVVVLFPGDLFWHLHPLVNAPSFLLGVGTSVVYRKLSQSDKLKFYSGVAFAAVVAVVGGQLLSKPSYAIEMAQVPGFMLFLLFLALMSERHILVKFFKNKFLVLLGKASYALYLFHTLTYEIWSRELEKVYTGQSRLLYVVAAIFMITVSVILYKFYEKPMYRLIVKVSKVRK
ncbi:MAG: peptidoglycan/LPS O-acetylase OafA/YrhL [Spirosomataceae bacterium]|jgi:peptidoglycan/LPS O-acetylase OafA/YrhL